MEELTFGEVYNGLFNLEYHWHLDYHGKTLVTVPQDYGLTWADQWTPVCTLCLLHACDSCSIGTGDKQRVRLEGRPPLGAILDGPEYYDGQPAREEQAHPDAEEPEHVTAEGAALVIQRAGSFNVIFPQALTWRTVNDAAGPEERAQRQIEAELAGHPAFQTVSKEEKEMQQQERQQRQEKTLVLYSDGGRRSNGSTYGSVMLGARRITREYGDGTNNQAEYKSLINALVLARETVKTNPGRFNTVEIRVDSELLQGQLMKGWHVNSPNLLPLWERAKTELATLLTFLHQRPDHGDSVTVRVAVIPGEEMKKVIGH